MKYCVTDNISVAGSIKTTDNQIKTRFLIYTTGSEVLFAGLVMYFFNFAFQCFKFALFLLPLPVKQSFQCFGHLH